MTEKKKRIAVCSREADKKWRENNKEKNTYINYRSIARVFIREMIKDEDLEEFVTLMNNRVKQIEQAQDDF